ncbi:acid-sensing ion channel 4-A-like [Erpetoichthys calabaricus]|uniref:acid-sensing ion channel 4-A-like n=1 Tax=Erpetoichthys calabaricus TaxID=27687 RepID=UPI002234B79F|nr:acid-sensing ion channel 4-A-like [Erpetoichthys calabaricus]
MPIEFVCKIKFAEEDEKQKGKQEGDKESLIEETCAPPTKDLAGFANSCALHGINHIFVSGRLGIKQTLWALAFLVSLAFFLYQAAKCAIFYLEHPHVTALDEEASPEMVFPAVTICNINRFRFSALTDADIYHLANLTGLPPKNKDGHKATDLVYPEPNMEDIFNRTGHQLEEMLMSCNFSGENCSAKDFSVFSQRPSLSMTSSLVHPLLTPLPANPDDIISGTQNPLPSTAVPVPAALTPPLPPIHHIYRSVSTC